MVPKKKRVSAMKNYRPISLLGPSLGQLAEVMSSFHLIIFKVQGTFEDRRRFLILHLLFMNILIPIAKARDWDLV